MSERTSETRRSWPDYAAVWRWHFYAGLFCLPFVCWLAITGSVYAFRPDIEQWLDRPYEALRLDGPPAAPSREARAAVEAVPGSVFSRYEPPATPTGAAQVVVLARDGRLMRVYVHPRTLRAMKIVQDDHRPMELLAHLHGQLLLGKRGSMVVEIAASWAVVMILTGLYLWFPRGPWRLGGLVYPRLGLRGRLLWRDLHAVAGLWVSLVTLFLLLSGLPWSANWGNYLTWARNHWAVTAGKPDWPIGGADPAVVPVAAAASPPAPKTSMPGMSAAEMAASPEEALTAASGGRLGGDLQALDKLAPIAAKLHVPRPIWISPPARGLHDWTISSQIQNRPLRVTYTVDPKTGAVTGTNDFARQNIVDKIVNVAVAMHEGQLFGRLNQAILVLNAAGLLLIAVSATVMWWRRRPADTLGAPLPAARPRFSALLAASIAALAVWLPLFGLTLVLVLVTDRALLPRVPKLRRWLGLAPTAA